MLSVVREARLSFFSGLVEEVRLPRVATAAAAASSLCVFVPWPTKDTVDLELLQLPHQVNLFLLSESGFFALLLLSSAHFLFLSAVDLLDSSSGTESIEL